MSSPLTSDKHVMWASSPAKVIELQALGWKKAPQRITHHSHHAILMIWDRPGDPVMPGVKQ